MKENKAKKNILKSIKYGSASIMYISIMIAIIVLINILTSMYNVKLDLTKSKLFSISDNSKQIINSISEDRQVELYGLYDSAATAGAEKYATLTELAKDYEANSNGRIKVGFVDPVKNPTFLSEIGVSDELKNSVTAAFAVKCGDKVELVPSTDCFSSETDEEGYALPDSLNAENVITAKINNVISESRKVYFVVGHGEKNIDLYYNQFRNSLQNNNYNVEKVNLLTSGRIPEDAEVLFFLSPTRDINKKEQYMLTKFFENSGAAVFCFDAVTDGSKMKNMENLLKKWNIQLNNDIVNENNENFRFDGTGTGRFTAHVPTDLTGVIEPQYILFDSSRSFTLLNSAKDGLSVDIILSTSPEGYTEDYSGDNISSESEKPVGMRAAMNYGSVNSKIMVFGDSDFLSDEVAGKYASLTGISPMIGYMQWVTGLSNVLMVKPKVMVNTSLEISEAEVGTVRFILIIISPLLMLGLALFVWLKRRHK